MKQAKHTHTWHFKTKVKKTKIKKGISFASEGNDFISCQPLNVDLIKIL